MPFNFETLVLSLERKDQNHAALKLEDANGHALEVIFDAFDCGRTSGDRPGGVKLQSLDALKGALREMLEKLPQ